MASFDPRYFQVVFLSLLLGFGVFDRDFGVTFTAVALVIGMGLGVQSVWVRLHYANWDSLWSALISSLSVLLLCRSQSLDLLCFAIGIAICSKYLFRIGEKHFYNPTNFGIFVTVFLSGRAWVSPGQWGSGVVMAAWIALMGFWVVNRSSRVDTAIFFLASWAILLGLRIAYLGQSWAVWQHQLSNGTILIFSFFMISDPRSTPDARMSRLFFAVLVALLTFHLRYFWQVPAAPLWALFFLSPLTIVLDKFWPHSRFEWRDHANRASGIVPNGPA